MTVIDGGKLQGEVRQLVSKIVEVAPEKIALDAQFVEELGADSMMALEIMSALEKKFNITIPEDDLPKLATLRQVCELVEKYRVNAK